VPTERQRLIFRGRLLKDTDLISHYKISDLDVVHLVAKTGEQINNSEESAINTEPNSRRRSSDSIFSLMNRLMRGESENNEGNPYFKLGQTENNNNNNTSTTTSTFPRVMPGIFTRRSRRTVREEANRNSDFNSIECRESILQNFATLNNLAECSTQSTVMENFSNSDVDPFDLFNFRQRKFIKGQWVDVKDTIEQWLEAQIIDVKDNQVYIHYNGWGTRWDEWINIDSDRIRPFRFHTRQSTYSHYQSPFPSVKPDANVSIESNLPPQDSFFDIFDEIERNYSHTKDMMKFIKARKGDKSQQAQKEVYFMSKRLTPFLDKLGRTMSDVGAFMNNSMRSNKLEDLDKKMYETETLDASLKAYDANEIRQVENEENSRRSTRESGMNCIYPVNKLDKSIRNQVYLFYF